MFHRIGFMIVGLSLLASGCDSGPTAGIGPDADSPSLPTGPSFIVNGFVDEEDTYANVGAFIVQRESDGQIFPICSGTLISATVFLTAAHCTEFYLQDLAPRGFAVFVSFDNPIGFGELTERRTQLLPVTQVISNPAFNQSQSDSGDLAVLILGRETRGVTPAALPSSGLLDELKAEGTIQDALFTAVGYGLQDRVVGGGVPFFQDLNPIPRMFAFESYSALSPGYLRLSQNPSTGDGGACFGDSGGPNFVDVDGEQILAATTITGDAVCRSTNVVYRLDTAAARAFLGRFVVLP